MIENIEWRHLFSPARWEADEKQWKLQLGPRFSKEAVQNLRKRRKWRGCLIIDANMLTGRWVDGVGFAPLAGQAKELRLWKVFLHSPAGNNHVKLSDGSLADHNAPPRSRRAIGKLDDCHQLRHRSEAERV